ncbi:hypothetical protein HSX11_06460 [Oxalobacteraceae bacterium]|nr:hypothetical protein [Oxalobacteraceae bacterium]
MRHHAYLPCLPPILARPGAALLLCAGMGMCVHAGAKAPAAPATREPIEQESSSFASYLEQQLPGSDPARARWDISRQRKGPWQVLARVDSAPLPRSAGLCQLTRSTFAYDARAPKAQRWAVGAAPDWYVWIASGSSCAAPANPVRLSGALADGQIAPLLRAAPALLERARLLFAGNTDCARLRSLPFMLEAIGPGAAGSAAASMFALRYVSDRASAAQVTVRKSGGELVAWNVSCPAQ